MSLPILAESKKGPRCHECTLRHRPGPVWGRGDQRAQFIYIGHKPGEKEVEQGEPFVGATGNIHNRQLFEAGLSRSRGYYTNLVRCLTENNRDPTEHEIACCKPLLDHELEQLKEAKVVVAAGAMAQENVLGGYSTLNTIEPLASSMLAYDLSGMSVFNRMGTVEQRDGRLWMSTIHPALIMHMPAFWDVSVQHLRKVKDMLSEPPELPRLLVEPSDADVRRHIEAARDYGLFADDVETKQDPDVEEDDYVGTDKLVDMCGFSAIPYEAVVLKPHRFHLVHELWRDENVWCAEHNGAYDMFYKSRIAEQRNKLFDTLVGAHLLRSCDKRKPLKPYTLSMYTNLPYYGRDLEPVHRRAYNAMDCVTTFIAAQKISRELKREKLWETFTGLEMRMVPIAERWRIEGVRVNAKRAEELKAFIERRVELGEEALVKLVGFDINWKSPKQVKELLYDKWKLPVQTKRDRSGGKTKYRTTTDAEARIKLMRWIEEKPLRKKAYEVPYAYLTLQGFLAGEKKKLEYFGRVDPKTSTIHPHWKTYGQHFMRLSSTPSLQNWPKTSVSEWGGGKVDTRSMAKPIEEEDVELPSLRSIIIPDHDDDLFISCDFEQIELWLYAAQTKCKWLLEQYESGEYIYGNIYEEFLGQPFFQPGKPRTKKYKLPTVSDKMLREAKTVPLGFLYGRQAEAVAAQYNWPVARTMEWRKRWFAKCPELLKSYTQDEFKAAQSGWRMRYPWYVIRFPEMSVTQVYNARGQAVAAGVLKSTIILLEQELKRFGRERTRTKLSVHDSITVNVHGGKKDRQHVIEVYETAIKPVMERPIPELDGFRLRHEATVGDEFDWNDVEYSKWKERYD